jgi:hypothetical protein
LLTKGHSKKIVDLSGLKVGPNLLFMNQTTNEILKYVLAILLMLVGIGFVAGYLMGSGLEKQPIDMLLGGLAILITGILVLPDVSKRISGTVAKLVLIFGLVASVFLCFRIYYSINGEIEFRSKLAEYEAVTVQRLEDVRSIEEAYFKIKGVYTDNWDSLQQFINDPILPQPYKSGETHDSIGGGSVDAYMERGLVLKRGDIDSVATLLGTTPAKLNALIRDNKIAYKIFDTSYVSYYELHLTPEVRAEKGLPPVDVKTLKYNPHPDSGGEFIIRTSSVEIGGVRKSTIEVKDPLPFGREGVKKDTLKFGSLTEGHTDGNWKKQE